LQYGRSFVNGLGVTAPAPLGASEIRGVVRPLYTRFEDIGVFDALRRLEAQLRFAHPALAEARLRQLPTWLSRSECDLPMGSIAEGLDPRLAMDLVHNLRAARLGVEATAGGGMGASSDGGSPLVATATHCGRVLVGMVRLAYGELLEVFAAQLATRMLAALGQTSGDAAHAHVARLWQDAYLVAVWTSAQARFVLQALERCATVREPGLATAIVDALPPPELHTVPCASNQTDLLALYERGTNVKGCSKAASAALALLVRCTQAGSRGWETALASSLATSDGTAVLCQHAVLACLTGLHPALQPALRPTWRERLRLLSAHPFSLRNGELSKFAKVAPAALKEAVRASLAAMLAADPAALAVQTGAFPVAQHLVLPPTALASGPLQTTAAAFAAVGQELLRAPLSSREVGQRLNGLLVSEGRTRGKRQSSGPAFTLGVGLPGVNPPTWLSRRAPTVNTLAPTARATVAGLQGATFRGEFVPFWMHAQCHEQRVSRLDAVQFAALHDGNALHKMVALLDDAESLRVRRAALRRVDAGLIDVPTVCALLRDDAALQQSARAREARGADDHVSDDATNSDPSDGEDDGEDESAPASEAAALGAGVAAQSSRAMQDAETAVLKLDANTAAHLVVFTQCASLREQLLCYDLGARTRLLQARALHRRFLRHDALQDPAESVVSPACVARVVAQLPAHATVAFACSECRRIVNAVQNGSGKNVGFTELGLASSMLRVNDCVCCGEMRCAKRSSAALRTALQLEAHADRCAVEGRAVLFGEPDAPSLPVDLRPASVVNTRVADEVAAVPLAAQTDAETEAVSGTVTEGASEVAKLRRDMKNAFEQRPRALACGDAPLVRVPVLGMAVRMYGEWYALCTVCGALAQLTALSRYGSEPCCMRCDCTMLFGERADAAVGALRPKPEPTRCRMCGKAEPEAGKWRRVKAPADTGGRNATVPPPLRMCCYCPTHWRPWIQDAHRTTSTSVIFAHIVTRAKPLFGADRGKRTFAEAVADMDAEAANASKTTAAARKRKPKRKLPGTTRLRRKVSGWERGLVRD